MIQIYSPSNTDYTKNGDMTLMATQCDVHAVLNGAWELELTHPIDADGRWKYIEGGAVISAPSFNGDQLFRIKETDKDDSGVTATAEPIFMDARDDCFLVDVRPTDKTGQQALDIMTAPNSKYTGSSNITKIATAYYQFKNLIEAINGNDDNSFVKRWGGEIYFNNYQVIINNQVGEDYGVSVLYGKNASKNGVSETIDTSNVITRIYPKAYNGYTMTNNGYVDSPLINTYPVIKARTITFDNVKMREDANEDDEENGIIICDTQEELDDALEEQCQAEYEAGADKPKVTISVDMVLVENTVNYAEYKGLETVSLGDTVHCEYYRLGIVTDARVREITYDCLRQRTTKVVIGDEPYQYFNNVSSGVNRIDGAIRPDGSLIAEQIQGFINSAYAQLRLQNSVAQKQDVRAILFEDLDPSSDLFGAISIGTQGLQIADSRTSDGRDWDWGTAITAKGMNASLITVGLISANMVRAGVLASQNDLLRFDLDDATLSVYADNTTKTLLMQMRSDGTWYYKNGVTVGKIGTDALADTALHSLVFNLESTGDMMAWAQETASGGQYDIKFSYLPKPLTINGGTFNAGLHIWGPLYTDGNPIYLNNVIRSSYWGNNQAGFRMEGGAFIVAEGTSTYFSASTPDNQVLFYRDINMMGNSVLNQSDARLKEKIEDSQISGMELINQLEVKSFDWINKNTHQEAGFIAQQVQEVIPSLIHDGGENGLSIKTSEMIPYLVKAIQELSDRVYQLEASTGQSKAMGKVLQEKWEDPYTEDEKMDFVQHLEQKARLDEIQPQQVILERKVKS